MRFDVSLSSILRSESSYNNHLLLNQIVWGGVSLIFREILFLEGTLAAEHVMIEAREDIRASTFKWTGYWHIHLFPVVDYWSQWGLKYEERENVLLYRDYSSVSFCMASRSCASCKFACYEWKILDSILDGMNIRNTTVVFLNECYDCPIWVN